MTELLKRLDGIQVQQSGKTKLSMSGGNLKAVLTCAAALLFQYFNQPAADPDDVPDKTADTDISGEGEAEGLHIVQLGTSNPNLLNYGGHAKIPQEYQILYRRGQRALPLCL